MNGAGNQHERTGGDPRRAVLPSPTVGDDRAAAVRRLAAAATRVWASALPRGRTRGDRPEVCLVSRAALDELGAVLAEW